VLVLTCEFGHRTGILPRYFLNFATVSKTSIPVQAPVQPGNHREPHRQRGSLLGADHPSNGVLFSRRITMYGRDRGKATIGAFEPCA
jgi:hypothetical protein